MDAQIRELVNEDKEYYYGLGIKRLYRFLTHNPLYQRGKYLIISRKAGYYHMNQNSLTKKMLYIYYLRRKNKLGSKLGIELGPNQFGRRLRIYHNNIVVNGGAIIGDDCELYGDNCIGNKGAQSPALDAPVLRDGVSLGVGTKVIGKVEIAKDIKVSSMSLVNSNLTEVGALYGGVPAKLIKNK